MPGLVFSPDASVDLGATGFKGDGCNVRSSRLCEPYYVCVLCVTGLAEVRRIVQIASLFKSSRAALTGTGETDYRVAPVY